MAPGAALASQLRVDQFGLTRTTALGCAATLGRRSAVDALLGAGADPRVRDAGKHGLTALHNAAYNGHTDTARILVRRGADPLAELSVANSRETCLAMALRLEHIDTYTFLQKARDSRTLLAKLLTWARAPKQLAKCSAEKLAEKIAARFDRDLSAGQCVELDAAADLVELQRRIEQGDAAFAAETQLEVSKRAARWKKPKAGGGKGGKKKRGKKGRR